MTTAHSETSEAVVPHGIGMAPKIEWFERSREELSDLFAVDGIPLRDRVWLSLTL